MTTPASRPSPEPPDRYFHQTYELPDLRRWVLERLTDDGSTRFVPSLALFEVGVREEAARQAREDAARAVEGLPDPVDDQFGDYVDRAAVLAILRGGSDGR